MEIHKTKKANIFYYFTSKGEKLYMFRHKYFDELKGKRVEKKKSGFKTEKAALRALNEMEAATLRGETKLIDNDNLSVSQWLDVWYETNQAKWKVTTRSQREMAIRLNMKPLLGHFKLQKLDKATYQKAYIRELEKSYKPNTVKLLHNLFKIAVNAAVEHEVLDKNRFTKISFASNDDSEDEVIENYFTPAELALILKTAKDTEHVSCYCYLLTMAYTGLRKGEACGLQWKNIDFTNNTITVERTRDAKGARKPKTKNSYRTILVDELVMKELKAYKTWCKQIMLAFGKRFSENEFVFISYQTAEPFSDSALLYMFRRVQIAAGLCYTNEKGKPVAKASLHALRHTHATILLNSGQNVKVIAERLGNTPAMIYEVYGHVLKEAEQETVSKFSDTLNMSAASEGAI